MMKPEVIRWLITLSFVIRFTNCTWPGINRPAVSGSIWKRNEADCPGATMMFPVPWALPTVMSNSGRLWAPAGRIPMGERANSTPMM